MAMGRSLVMARDYNHDCGDEKRQNPGRDNFSGAWQAGLPP
jgi:hypothetical protein